MELYNTIGNILIEKTPFIILIHNDSIELHQDIKSFNRTDTLENMDSDVCGKDLDDPFASLDIIGKQIIISIHEFLDWKSIHILMRLGHHLLDYFCEQKDDSQIIESVMIECKCDMEEEFIYEYRMNKHPWYFPFGYIPYLKNWHTSELKDFYQIPFLKPDEYLELKNAKKFICPDTIILEKQKDPLHLVAQKSPNHLHLRLLPSTSFYNKSKRPITSMSLLRRNKFYVLDLSKIPRDIIKSGAPFKIENDFYVPVVRYSNGMRNGCYFDLDEKNQYLGTFYYWEPESECYLRMGKKFDYFENKFHCATTLIYKLEEYDEITGGEFENVSKLIINLDKYLDKILRDVTKQFKKEYEEYLAFERVMKRNSIDGDEYDAIIKDEFGSIYNGKTPNYLPISNEYKSLISGKYMRNVFYASEDELDQSLAQALVFLGYEVVIFGRMAGMFRVVSEVFDVRPRETSFDNLCWRVD